MSEVSVRCPYCKIGSIPEKWLKANPDLVIISRADYEEALWVLKRHLYTKDTEWGKRLEAAGE